MEQSLPLAKKAKSLAWPLAWLAIFTKQNSLPNLWSQVWSTKTFTSSICTSFHQLNCSDHHHQVSLSTEPVWVLSLFEYWAWLLLSLIERDLDYSQQGFNEATTTRSPSPTMRIKQDASVSLLDFSNRYIGPETSCATAINFSTAETVHKKLADNLYRLCKPATQASFEGVCRRYVDWCESQPQIECAYKFFAFLLTQLKLF